MHAFWLPHAQICDFHAGAQLVIALPRPAIVHWGTNGWRGVVDQATTDNGIGCHVACLDVGRLNAGEGVDFTWKRDYSVRVVPAE